MEWVAAITAVATLLAEVITLGYKVARLWRESQLKGWVKDGRKISEAINGAKTEEERAVLSKLLFERRSL